MHNLETLLRIPHVDNSLRFGISTDQKQVVFSWNKSGKWALHSMSLRGRALPEAISISDEIAYSTSTMSSGRTSAFLATTYHSFSPRFSPDGKQLAYAVDFDGSESFHIVLRNLQNNSVIDLTPNSGYAQQPNFDFSPDGKTLAILSDEHGQFALYLLSIETLHKKLLFDIHRPIWDVAWSPDGKFIAAETESTGSDRTIYIVDSTNGNFFQLQLGDEILNAQHPTWAPDSNQLAFSGENGEWHDIGVFNIETQEITWVNESAGDDTQPAWSRSGECIGWVHAKGARTSFQFKRRGDAIKQAKVGDGVHYLPQFNADSVVILYEDVKSPCDLWKINLEDGSLEQLTNSLPDELRGAEFIQPEEIWYAGKDGAQVPALLYRAKDSKRAVINIHGGPNWLYQFLWYPLMSHMASRGWTVLAPNYRGSTGYGKKWQNASRFDFGGVDNDDCAAGVDYLIANGLADKDKIGITGRSHGGYLTMTCMTSYPELWAVGSAVVPFLNWIKSHYESREDLQHWNIENMGDPETNRDLWVERSPYFFLDKMNAPVQMICGENDPRCPASESIDARDKLLEIGKDVELLLYKDEGHSFLKIENVIDAEVKRVEFLAKVLEKI